MINKYSGVVSIIMVLIPAVWLGIDYLQYKSKLLQNQKYEFITSTLANIANKNSTVDEQVLSIYELRNHPEYFEVTERILNKIINSENDSTTIFYKEIKLTLNFIKNNK